MTVSKENRVRSVPLHHFHDTTKFDCGTEALNRFLKTEAIKNQQGKSERTFIITQGREVIGFYTLRPFIQGVPGCEVASLEVGRLAVDKNSGLSAETLWQDADTRRFQARLTRKGKSAPGH